MKNGTAVLCLLAGLLCIASCTSQDDIPEIELSDASPDGFVYTEADDKPYPYNCADGTVNFQYDGVFLYFRSGTDSYYGGSTVCRLNPETGVCTTVCIDPLCTHDTPDCPFYGLQGPFYVYDGAVIYNRVFTCTERNPNGSIRKNWDVAETDIYDTATSKLKVLNDDLEKSRTDYLRQLFCGRERYYYDYVYDEKTEDYFLQIVKQNLDSGKTVLIGGENNRNAVTEQVVFALDGRIWFTDGERLYSQTTENTEETVHCRGRFGESVLTDGENVYFELYEDGKKNVYRLTDPNDYGSAEKVISDCTEWKLTEHWLYYCDASERVIGKNKVPGYAGDSIVLSGNGIHRCDHDGKNDETVFAFEGDYANYQLFGMTVLDNYVYGLYQVWTDGDGDGIFREGDMSYSGYHDGFSIMRIDVTDGSVYFLDCGK